MRHTIVLKEFEPQRMERKELGVKRAKELLLHYRSQVDVEYPSPKTEGRFELRPKGWVGHIPIDKDVSLSIRPKAPLSNIFGMWELAHRLDFLFPSGLKECKSLEEFFERLAMVLARKVIDRTRKGLYRAYVTQEEDLPFVRGRIDVSASLRRFGTVALPCRYQDHTADILENRILAWTLWRVIFSGLCTDRTLPTLQKAYRGLKGIAGAVPCKACDCDSVYYNRLNADYRPLHALCRFFLEQTGPTHRDGDRRMLPFLVDMSRLFELFVAEWTRLHIGKTYLVQEQHILRPGGMPNYQFRADMVIRDGESSKALCVVDTKYKNSDLPDQADVAQVVAYAELAGCQHALLVYPKALGSPIRMQIGRITVSSTSFDLDGELDISGEGFLEDLLREVHSVSQSDELSAKA